MFTILHKEKKFFNYLSHKLYSTNFFKIKLANLKNKKNIKSEK